MALGIFQGALQVKITDPPVRLCAFHHTCNAKRMLKCLEFVSTVDKYTSLFYQNIVGKTFQEVPLWWGGQEWAKLYTDKGRLSSSGLKEHRSTALLQRGHVQPWLMGFIASGECKTLNEITVLKLLMVFMKFDPTGSFKNGCCVSSLVEASIQLWNFQRFHSHPAA